MPTRAQSPQVSARIGAFIVQAAVARGVEAGQLLQAAAVPLGLLDDPQARLPLAAEEQLWEHAARLTDDPLFGLHAASALRPGAFDVLDYAVRTAPDLHTALQRLARYNRLVHDLAAFHPSPTVDGLRIEHRFDGLALQPCRHASEFTLASLVVVASQLCAQAVQATAVEFAHAAAGPVAAYQAIFGVAPRFRTPVAALTLADGLLRQTIPSADPGLSRIVTAHAEGLLASTAVASDSLALRIRRQLAQELPHGPTTLAQAAQALHLSTRSLQRRLEEEGTCFADLLDAVRHELALRYLADERLALGEIAYLLGFAEPSPFHRAFKRWTGSTPAAARHAHRERAGP